MPQLSEADILIKTTADNSGVDQARSSVADLGASVSSVGRSLTAGFTVPVVAGATLAAKAFMDFHQQMELAVTQAGATQQEVDAMGKSIEALAGKVGQTPEALAEGFFHLASVGLHGQEALDALTAAAEGASVGQADLESVTNALTSALVSGIGGVKDARDAMGTLNAIVGAGNMRMGDLTAAMSSGILPSAKAFGLSIQDVGAALATMTDSGVPAEEAATRLRMTFSELGAPTQAAAKELATLGLSSTQLADDMRSKGLGAALQDLKDHLEKTGLSASEQAEVLSKAFGGGKSSSAIITLIQELDRVDAKYKQIGQTAGNFGAAVEREQNEPLFKFKQTLAQVQVALVSVGQSLMPVLTGILQQAAKVLAEFSSWWQGLSPRVQDFAIKGALVLALLGPLLIALGGVISAVAAVTAAFESAVAVLGALSAAALVTIGWVAAIGIAVAALAYLVATHWDRISASFRDGYQKVADGLSWLKGNWEEALGYMLGYVASLPFKIPGYFTDSFGRVAAYLGAFDWAALFRRIGEALSRELDGAWKSFTDLLSKVGGIDWGSALKSAGKGVEEGILAKLPHFAGGVDNFSGGAAVVGERGPELVTLPSGASVIPNHRIGAAAPGGQVTIHQTNYFTRDTDPLAAARELGFQLATR